ncbi:Wzz/FepE/Etk N-terminal domain-containing protein [Knoellia sp. p5-6-4]|uniref:Wzz/FepE/Etk N-terminal domain-containing protein n=1 Tax=unclassified Knoellia TaxID=2618719 RepID=UPI0023DB4819|nr:Wzz/FepE/Etk N-terminal domain-containing protein [Knoellia sp. p5-6-4]MDF2146899.1 Wzz/FepE/Etk N-terminal domain-containing protein [Knoellia sp. p5-6-4]
MEIVDYLRAARRRIALIILIPLVAAGSAAALLFLQKPDYISTATVDPPALVGSPTSQYTGSQGVIQFVAAFQATATGPVVRQKVSDQTGVDPTKLLENLLVTQRGGSASVAVTYTSPVKAEVEKVVEATSTETLRAMFSSQVTTAQSRLDDAEATLKSASEAVGAFTAKNRMADPQKAYEAQLNRVNTLAQQQATMRAAGNAVGAAALSAPIASAAAGLDKFGPILTEYNTLVENRSAAASAVTAAQVQLANAKSQFDAADPTKTVFISGARFVDSTETMTRTVIAVGVAAFFLALLIVAMLEVIARGRRERPVAEPGSGEAAPGEAFPHAAPTGRMAPKGSAAAANSGTPSHGIPARAKHH